MVTPEKMKGYEQERMSQRGDARIGLRCISGLAFRREASCDQKSGIDPRTCTTELIRSYPGPDPVSSTTICSVSTSLATRPLSFTPRFKYLSANHAVPLLIEPRIHGFTMANLLRKI